IPQAVLFRSGADEVSPRALPVVAHIGAVLRDIPNQVSLGGACRCRSHPQPALQEQLGSVHGAQLEFVGAAEPQVWNRRVETSVASYGPYRPTGSNYTPAGRALNRRVEIVILDEPARP